MLYPVSPPWKVIVWGLVNSSVETIHVEIQHSPAMSRKTARRIALEFHNRGQHCWPLSFHQTTAGRACHWETVRWTASHVRPWLICGRMWWPLKFCQICLKTGHPTKSNALSSGFLQRSHFWGMALVRYTPFWKWPEGLLHYPTAVVLCLKSCDILWSNALEPLWIATWHLVRQQHQYQSMAWMAW